MQHLLVLLATLLLLQGAYSFIPLHRGIHKFSQIKIQQPIVTSNFQKPSSPAVAPKTFELSSTVAASQAAVINKAAIRAIAKLLSTCGIGAWAGSVGILDQNALGVLSKLIFNIFQPCLLFVNVASTVAKIGGGSGTSEAITLLPFAAAFQILTGFIVGKIVSLLIYGTKPADEGSKQLLACTTFGNSGPLPLVFTDGLFRAHPDASLLPKSVAYISLYLLGWSPLFWIIGPGILEDESAAGKAVDPKKKTAELLKRIFSPPVVGSILGMVVGFVPFLQNIFINSNGILNPIFEAMRTLGAAYLPAVLMVLAGSLSSKPAAAPAGGSATAPAAATAAATAAAPSTESDGFAMRVASVYIARFLLMPVVSFGLYKLAITYIPATKALFHKDPLLLLVLLLESCMPSAQNTTVILQLQGKKDAATRLARLLMSIYVLGVPAISFWLVKILQLTQLAA